MARLDDQPPPSTRRPNGVLVHALTCCLSALLPCSYGVAINRDQAGGALEQRLVWALTRREGWHARVQPISSDQCGSDLHYMGGYTGGRLFETQLASDGPTHDGKRTHSVPT